MFTQCSNCHTVFQLSAEVLRAAGGQVRCGRCGEIFSALARLAEDANAFDTGESAYEMEERADSILESVVAEQAAQALPESAADEDFNGEEIAHLQVLDFTEEDLVDEPAEETPDELPPDSARDLDAEAAMEFTLPPGELDRIFIESKSGVAAPFPLDYSDTDPESLEPPTAATQEPIPTPLAVSVAAPAAAAPVAAAAASAVAPQARNAPGRGEPAPTPAAEDDGPLPDIEVISDNRTSDAIRRPQLPVDDLGILDLQQAQERPAGSFALWLGAAIAAALLLLAQVVHRNREALTAHGPLAPALRLLYSSIGAPLNNAPNLSVYQLRQWGVTGDPQATQAAAEATLRVRASILNTSAQLQPFPLLRVTLANRYGTRMGARDFEPAEYLGKSLVRQLSPGETADAILNIRDPGKDAEGFEIDVCLRGADKKIICANDAAPTQAKP